ncbi:MAG: DEAD/DEAH box helicase [Sulfolobales archaeon]
MQALDSVRIMNLMENLHPLVREVIDKILRFKSLTKVQEEVIRYLMKTSDNVKESSSLKHLLVIAPVGTGKTYAVLLPILSKILYRRSSSATSGIKILYITPLRALNRDLFERLIELFKFLGLEIRVWHGDTSYSERKRIREKPPIMLITTPESLQNILASRALIEAFRDLEYVIVDEIHELIDSERGCELSVALERLWEISGPHMRIGVSGSVGSPDLVARFLAGVNRAYDIIDVSSGKEYLVNIVIPNLIDRRSHYNDESDIRIEMLERLLERLKKPVLIFTNTRDQAEYIGSALRLKGLNMLVHHGSLSKDERVEAEKSLREGLIDGVIATSSLELGIDIGVLENVIQISSARQVTKLIQRIGRSGHREQIPSRGFVIPMLNLFDIAESSVLARRASDLRINRRNLESARVRVNPLDVLAHQIVGISMSGEASIENIKRIVRRSYCFKDIKDSEIEEVISFLKELKMLTYDGKNIKPTRKGEIYYYSTTMITDTKKYYVIDMISRKIIGALDEEFVVREVEEDATIALGGRFWVVRGVSEDKIYVEEARESNIKIPRWIGQQIPVEYRVAREVCSMINLSLSDPRKASEIWSRDAVEIISRIALEHVNSGSPLPREDLILVEKWFDPGSGFTYLFLYTCLGSRGNRALLYLLQASLRELAIRSFSGITPYSIVLLFQSDIDPILIERIIRNEALRHADTDHIESRIVRSIEESNEIKWYIVSVARKLGVISREISLREARRFAESYRNTILWKEAVREALHELIDLDVLRDFLRRVNMGKVTFSHVTRSSLSIMAKASLEILSGYEVVRRGESLPPEMLAEIVRRRLDEKNVELICLSCGYSYSKKLRDIQDPVRCERCGAVLVGLNKYESEKAKTLVRRVLTRPYIIKRSDSLTSDEKELIEFLRESADMIASNGKKALYALMGVGIGIDTAKKILWNSRTDQELFINILEAEKKYLRTREFWNDR